MHGMINRAIQCFVQDTYGPAVWMAVVKDAKLEFENFEAMLQYPDRITVDILSSATRQLSRPFDSLLEDIGTYLVSHPNVEALRRLLRFGGADYTEFMFSLNEVEGRVKLALPDIDAVCLCVCENPDGSFTLTCNHALPRFGYVLIGLLRAMADDYGALVFLEHQGWTAAGAEEINIRLLESAFAEGRSFELSANKVSA